MARYVLCPRCELNFIDADEREYCEVCTKELSGEKTFSDDFEEEENLEGTELCPICGENYMAFGEKMCEECKTKNAYEEEMEEDEDKEDASWRSYLDDEDEELDLGIPDSEFEDDSMDDDEEMEEESEDDDDDFEIPDIDESEFEEDEEEEDEEEDGEDF